MDTEPGRRGCRRQPSRGLQASRELRSTPAEDRHVAQVAGIRALARPRAAVSPDTGTSSREGSPLTPAELSRGTGQWDSWVGGRGPQCPGLARLAREEAARSDVEEGEQARVAAAPS